MKTTRRIKYMSINWNSLAGAMVIACGVLVGAAPAGDECGECSRDLANSDSVGKLHCAAASSHSHRGGVGGRG